MSKRFKIFVTVVFAFVMLSGSVNALGDRIDVTVVDNGVSTNYITYVSTAGEFLSEVGIHISPNDKINYEENERLSTFARNTINITRGVTVEVIANSSSRMFEVPYGYRVGHVIQLLKDETGIDYKYDGNLGLEVYNGQRIELHILRTEIVNEYVVIPYNTETVYSADILEGQVEIINPGADGLKQVTTKIEYLNYTETSRVIVGETVSAPPITRVVHVGTGKPVEVIPEAFVYTETMPVLSQEYMQLGNQTVMPQGYMQPVNAQVMPQEYTQPMGTQDAAAVSAEAAAFVEQAMLEWGIVPGENAEVQEAITEAEPETVQETMPAEPVVEEVFDPDAPPKQYLKKMTMRATAYTSDYASTGKNPGHPLFGVTASGTKAKYGVVAVDPNVIALGTKLYIYGYGYCVAGDTGSAIVGDRIDLYLNTSQECYRYGVRTIEVYVLE